MKYRADEEWEEIILKAYDSSTSIKRWCAEHQVKYPAFLKARKRLMEKGKIPFLTDTVSIPLCDTNGAYAKLPLNESTAFLVLKPIRSNLSMEAMAAVIWFELNLPLLPGQTFFFISRSRKQVYALKICENGYCLCSRKLEHGSFGWPSIEEKGHAALPMWQYQKIVNTLLNAS